jgi:hypothetical protein
VLGFLEGTRNPERLSQQELTLKFTEFYGCELLKKVGCNFERNSGWIVEIFRQSGKNHYHPLLHALIQVFLEDECAKQGRKVTDAMEIRDETRGWKCPNPYALHDNFFRIPSVGRRWSQGKRYLSARCSCGYAFSFRHACATDPLLPEITRVSAWGPHFEREAKRLKDEGLSIRQICSTMNVCHEVATRLHQGKRNRFEFTERQIRSWRDKWLKTRSKTLYRLLDC